MSSPLITIIICHLPYSSTHDQFTKTKPTHQCWTFLFTKMGLAHQFGSCLFTKTGPTHQCGTSLFTKTTCEPKQWLSRITTKEYIRLHMIHYLNHNQHNNMVYQTTLRKNNSTNTINTPNNSTRTVKDLAIISHNSKSNINR